MENNFIQMAASGGHAVAYTIDSIFKHIIDCVQLYFTNCFTNILPLKRKLPLTCRRNTYGDFFSTKKMSPCYKVH